MIQVYNYHCQGESHKKNDNKPCQDFSIGFKGDDIAIAIVSDGHGGDRYFRSHFGSKFIAEIAQETINESVLPIGKVLFENKEFTQVGISKERKDKPVDKDIERTMQSLFASIITQWYDKIKEHAKNNPLDEWEEQHVPEKYKIEFNEQNKLEKNYGCTLMVYVQTPIYWFAFHIGDGKCVAFYLKDNKLSWQEPILWDEACFLNTTTSICDSNAIEEFRYSYCGDGTFPIAVFLGSDGIDDSYGTPENLSTFYQQLLQEMANKNPQEMTSVLEESLPEISRIGSQDDMSVVCVYDDEQVRKAQKAILDYQKNLKRNLLSELQEKRKAIEEKIKSIASRNNDRAKDVELKYANNDLAKIDKEIQKVESFLLKNNNEICLLIISEREKELALMQGQKETLSQQLKEAHQHETSLSENLQEVRTTHEQIRDELEQKIQQYKNALISLEEENSDLKGEVKNKQKKIEHLYEQLEKFKRIKKILLCSCIVLSILCTLVVVFTTTKLSNSDTNFERPLENVPEITQIL